MDHSGCIHARIGHATYCCSTQLVYVRPDEVPTTRGRKNRGDDCEVFARLVRAVNREFREIPVGGYVLMTRLYPLPTGGITLPDIIALRRHLEIMKDRVD